MYRKFVIQTAALALASMGAIPSLAAQGGRGGGGTPAIVVTPQGQPIDPLPPYVRTSPPSDPVIQRMWRVGMDSGQAGKLAQVLMDSVGPRLTGSPGMKAASDWVIATYGKWGIQAKAENYGTWNNWRRGVTHVDLVAPRVRTLEATMIQFSPGTNGQIVEGEVMLIPDLADSTAFNRWLPQARGKYFLLSVAQPSCRMPQQWEQFGAPGDYARVQSERQAEDQAYQARMRKVLGVAAPDPAGGGRGAGGGGRGGGGNPAAQITARLAAAGAAGIFRSSWTAYPAIHNVLNSTQTALPVFEMTCEDFGLIYRLAKNNQGPRVRVQADAQFLGELPVFNTIAQIRGSEKPDEYIMLSAHFDSWDAASGAVDNGTGTITMLEAMRILKTVYPNPKRTIIVGHWNGEEQGLIGSRAFSEDHPEVVKGMHSFYNQDNGTGRIVRMNPGGLVKAGPVLKSYLSQIPKEITQYIQFSEPGGPSTGGTDNASFACYGVPAFGLGALGWDYGPTTHHTNRDTYDKIVINDLKNNATLTAMLVYLADIDPVLMPRDKADGVTFPTSCAPARRQSGRAGGGGGQ